MDVCQSTLSAALQKTDGELVVGALLGLGSVWGWGIGVETALRGRLASRSLAHAFLQGTVAVAGVLLVLALCGVTGGRHAVAFAGIAWGALCLIARRGTFAAPPRPSIALLVGAVTVVLGTAAALQLITTPLQLGDATFIWGFRAKVLTCEPLFASHQMNEPVWAGTHPEYPLFFPLLHSYFFSLTSSFRDDWSKIWSAASVVAVVAVLFRDVRRVTGSSLAGAVAGVLVAALVPTRAFDGRVELSCVIFTALVAVCLFTKEHDRLPLYLFGLATSKNEGLASALVLIVCWIVLLRRDTRRGTFVAALVPLAAWIAVLSTFPSHHEEYPSRLVSIEAWTRGLARLPQMLAGWLSHGTDWPWVLVFPPLVVVVPLLVAQRARKGQASLIAQDPRVFVALLWPFTMLVVFAAIYVVTPWGTTLYQMTLDRLLLQIVMPAALALVVLLAAPAGAAARAVAKRLLVLVLGALTWTAVAGIWSQAAEHRPSGFAAYAQAPPWQRALALDAQLPLAATGAVVDEPAYFAINYTLYPRVLHPAQPSTVAGTLRAWTPYGSLADVDAQGRGYRFVVEDARVIWAR